MGGGALYCKNCGLSGRIRIETNEAGNSYFDFDNSPFYQKNLDTYCRKCNKPVSGKEPEPLKGPFQKYIEIEKK